jgi:mannosyltransferase
MTSKTMLCLLLILVTGGLLRSWQLVERSLWMDEAFSFSLIHDFSWPEMIRRTASDYHPPLYYCLLRLWVGIFGESVLALRGFSFLLGEFSVLAIFFFCRDAATQSRNEENKKSATGIGLIAAALLALSGEHVRWSQESRMYILGTTLALCSTWLILRALQSPRRAVQWWMAYVVVATSLLYTHNYGLFSVVAQACFVTGVALVRCGFRISAVSQCSETGLGIVAFSTILLAYLPWLRIVWEQKQQVQGGYWVPELTIWTIPDSWCMLFMPRFPFVLPSYLESGLLFATLVSVLGLLASRPSAANLATILMVVIPIVLSGAVSTFVTPITFYRHFLFAHGFAVAALALAMGEFVPRSKRPVAAGVLCVNMLLAYIQYWNDLAIAQRPGVKGAIEHVLGQKHLSDHVLVTDSATYVTAKYYGRGHLNVRLLKSPGGVIRYLGAPVLTDSDSVHSLDELCPSCRRIWVVSRRPNLTAINSEFGKEWVRSEYLHVSFQEIFGCWLSEIDVILYEKRLPDN